MLSMPIFLEGIILITSHKIKSTQKHRSDKWDHATSVHLQITKLTWYEIENKAALAELHHIIVADFTLP